MNNHSSTLPTLAFLFLIAGVSLCAQAQDQEEAKRTLPLFADWFTEQDIDLPLPYGAGVAFIQMKRDVEVEDVRVSFAGRPPQSVAENASFEVRNSTSLVTARFDAWILPFVGVYMMAGETSSEAIMRTTLSFDLPGPGAPIEQTIETNSTVSGPLLGAGLTGVAGAGDWFGMFDANYGKSDLDQFDGELDVWLLSGRFGKVMKRDKQEWMLWGGFMYMDSRRTITISTDIPIIGRTLIEVDQRPVNPTTFQLGGSVTLNKHWNFLLEAGYNTENDRMLVLSSTYRF